MREILFRGKRIDSKEWVDGFYYKDATTGRSFIITWEDGKDHGCLTIEEFREVIPETVGQFTGMAANGKEIFEGDVVVAELKSGTYQGFSWGKQKVVFWRGAFCLESRTGEKTPLGSYSPAVLFKVIGNIHDNQELLEVDDVH